MKSLVYWGLCCVVLGGSVPAKATSITIVPTFDSTITSDPNAASIEATINTAIATYQALFSNPITVDIYFQEGGGLGQSEDVIFGESYTRFYNALVAGKANPAAIAALQANGGNPTNSGPGATGTGDNPVTGTAGILLKTANSRALDPTGAFGLNEGPACQLTTAVGDKDCGGTGAFVDGIISLNTSITDPPGANDGSNYGLLATAEHEIDEILGLGSGLENNSSTANVTYSTSPLNDPAPEDLYRWSAPTGGTRTFSTNCATPTGAYFSYGPSTGELQQFNNSCNSADYGDWASSGIPQVQDAFGTPGANPVLGAAEIEALTSIGYTLAAPEPAMFLPIASVLGFFLLRFRRRD